MRGWEGALRRYSEPSRSLAEENKSAARPACLADRHHLRTHCSLKQLVFFTYSVSGVQMAPESFRGRATTELCSTGKGRSSGEACSSQFPEGGRLPLTEPTAPYLEAVLAVLVEAQRLPHQHGVEEAPGTAARLWDVGGDGRDVERLLTPQSQAPVLLKQPYLSAPRLQHVLPFQRPLHHLELHFPGGSLQAEQSRAEQRLVKRRWLSPGQIPSPALTLLPSLSSSRCLCRSHVPGLSEGAVDGGSSKQGVAPWLFSPCGLCRSWAAPGRVNLATSTLLAAERMRGRPAVSEPGGLPAVRLGARHSLAPSQMACSSSSSSSNCPRAGRHTSVPSTGLGGCGGPSSHSKTESWVGAAGEAQAALGTAPAAPEVPAGDGPSSGRAAS